MADVTITEFYSDPDYFNKETNPGYPYGGISGGGSPGSGLTLLGGVDTRVVTATSASSMKANEYLLFDGTDLMMGGESPRGAESNTITVGKAALDTVPSLELLGNRTSNARLGSLRWFNEAATSGIESAFIYASRYNHDNAGIMYFSVTDDAGDRSTELGILTDRVTVYTMLEAPDVEIGGITAYGSADHAATIGSTTLTELGGIELIGNQTSVARVGQITFHNTAATQSDKKVAEIYGERGSTDNTASVKTRIADTTGASMDLAYAMDAAAHTLYIEGTETLYLTSSGLVPWADDTYVLGWSTLRWSGIYGVNLDLTGTISFTDTNTQIWEDGSSNLTFKDAVTGTKTLAELAAGNTYTFESGLTEAASTVTLGGALTGDATIELGIYSFEVQLASLDTWFVVADEEVSMYTTDGSDVAELDIYPNEIYLHAEDATTNEASFSLFQDGTIDFIFTKEYMVTDNSATEYGIQYAADYTATFLTRSLVDKGYVDAAVGGVVGMVYPGAGIALSTGSAWGTSIANNSTDWDTAYTHSQVTTGNPHSIGYADIADFNTGVSTYETSHSDVVVDGDFAANGILRRSGAGAYTSLTGSSAVDSVESTLTNDNTHLPTSGAVYAAISAGMVYPGAGIALSTGSAWGTSITNNSANWNTAYGWGDHAGLYDTTGTAASAVSSHESTYNHANYNTAYTHSTLTTGNPHSVSWSELTGARSGISLSGFDDDLNYNDYTHPNHSGHVTSTGDGATVLTVSAITGQTALTTGLASDDELLVSDAGVIKRMDISVIEAYMQANLTFTSAGLWTDNGTSLSPVTGGHDILLAVNTERLVFGDGDTYIYEPTDDQLVVVLQGNTRLTFVENSLYASIGLDWRPSANKVWDLGTSVYFWDNAYIDRLYIDNTNTYIDVSGTEMSFTDAVSGTVTLGAMESPWTKSSTNISPATPGDDILLAQGSERIIFGDADTYIYEAADDDLYFISGGTTMFGITTLSVFVENKLIPNTTKTHDLGSTSLWWDNTYVDRLYVDNVNTYLDVDGAEMTFTDSVSGTQKLSDLVGSGASSPLTTKGDVWGFSTVDARIPIGTDGYALVADSTEALGVKWGVWGNVVYDVTLTDNTTTNITVGDTTNNRAITVKYSLVRDTDYRSGTIDILNSGGVITDDGGSYFGDSCGLTVSADASAGNIRLNCLLTSTGNNASFEYVLIYPDYSTSTAPASYTHPNHSGHVTSVGDGAQTLVVAAITGQTALTSGLVSTDELLVNDVSAGTLKRMDISVIEAYMQANLTFGGSSLWTDNGTSLSPASGGHDLLLAVATERIIFGDGDSYIYENADDVFQFVLNSTLLFQLSEPAGTVTVGANFIPTSTKAHDIGSATLFFDNAYVDRLYVDNTNTYIDISTGDMTFTDVNSGTVSLSTLVAGGSSPWTKSGTNLSPTTPGDDILLRDSTERLAFGDGDTYIYEPSDDQLTFYSGGGNRLYITSSVANFTVDARPGTTKTYSLGSSSLFWDNVYVDRAYIYDSGNWINGNSGSVSIYVDSVQQLYLSNTIIYAYKDFRPGANKAYDLGASTYFWDNAYVDDLYIDSTSLHIGSTAAPAFTFAVSSVTKMYLDASAMGFYVHATPAASAHKDIDLGTNTVFWRYAYIDKVYFGSVDNNITEVGSDMTFTDDTAGTATLQELYTGGTVNYTTIDTHTPTKYYKHLNVYYSGGSTGTINVDLDAYELSSDDSMVTISYYVSAPPGVTINIRDSSNSVIFTVSNGGSIIQASKILVWDNAANTWRVII